MHTLFESLTVEVTKTLHYVYVIKKKMERTQFITNYGLNKTNTM